MEKYKHRTIILGLPKMINASSRNSWRAVYSERKKWKALVLKSFFWVRPKQPLEKAKVSITRFSSKCPDYDGQVSAGKAILDGLVEAGIIIDDNMNVIGAPEFKWMKAKPRMGCVEIVVEEI